MVFFGILDDGKSPEKFCEFSTTYTIVRILSSLSVLLIVQFINMSYNFSSQQPTRLTIKQE
jgi:hypothetical protein